MTSVPAPNRLWCLWNGCGGTAAIPLSNLEIDVPDLTGKWIIITGSNNGIGFEAAKKFARAGANLILACRDPPSWEVHPQAAVEKCKELALESRHNTRIEWWEINMADFSSVEAFAKRWLATGRPLDILCNNAGMGPPASDEPILTTDGFEILHQVNFTSHVLLTLLLLDSLAQAPEPRIVCTTSSFHFLGTFDLDNFNSPKGIIVNSYCNNKLYFQMWLVELHTRLMANEKYRHITVNGIHPGYVNSSIWENPRPDVRKTWIHPIAKLFARLLAINEEQGSLAIVYAATSPEFGPNPHTQGVGSQGGRGGGHYINRIWETTAMPHCRDQRARLQVWDKVSVEIRSKERGLSDLR